MLGRVVGPLATGRRRPEPGASRRDLPPPRPVPPPRTRGRRPDLEEARPAEAGGPRDRRDVAMRRQPRTARALAEGSTRRRAGEGSSTGRRCRDRPSGASAGSGPGSRSTGRPTRSSPATWPVAGPPSLLGGRARHARERDDLSFALVASSPASPATGPATWTRRLRDRVLDRLAALGADDEATAPVREFVELRSSQQSFALGDALPIGLRLGGGLISPSPAGGRSGSLGLDGQLGGGLGGLVLGDGRLGGHRQRGRSGAASETATAMEGISQNRHQLVSRTGGLPSVAGAVSRVSRWLSQPEASVPRYMPSP